MELMQYVRRGEQRKKVGVLVSNEYNSVGWALCNLSAGDTFDREKGLSIARGRERNNVSWTKAPQSLHEDIAVMLERSRRYFK